MSSKVSYACATSDLNLSIIVPKSVAKFIGEVLHNCKLSKENVVRNAKSKLKYWCIKHFPTLSICQSSKRKSTRNVESECHSYMHNETLMKIFTLAFQNYTIISHYFWNQVQWSRVACDCDSDITVTLSAEWLKPTKQSHFQIADVWP